MKAHVLLFLFFGLVLSGCTNLGEKSDCAKIAGLISDETGKEYRIMTEEYGDDIGGCFLMSQFTERDVIIAFGPVDTTNFTETDFEITLGVLERNSDAWTMERRDVYYGEPMPSVYLEGWNGEEPVQKVTIIKDGWLVAAEIYGTRSGELHTKATAFRIAEAAADYLNSKE